MTIYCDNDIISIINGFFIFALANKSPKDRKRLGGLILIEPGSPGHWPGLKANKQ
jgi:hypothetical protein